MTTDRPPLVPLALEQPPKKIADMDDEELDAFAEKLLTGIEKSVQPEQ